MILALDQGTTSCRAILFDHSGAPVCVAQKEFSQRFPKPGWVEHDANEIWATQAGVAAEALARSGISSREVAAIGITNQRETTVLWDRKTGEPIAPAIVWQDRRTAGACDEIRANARTARDIQKKTGLVVDAYFSATKISWLLDHTPNARARAGRGELAFGTMDSWLTWKLTHGARHVTDLTNASRTMLLDLESGEWDEAMLALFNIPREILPEVVGSSEVVGEAALPGLSGPPIAGLAGDQQAALFGQACVREGMAKNTYGTGCFLLLHTGGKPVESKRMLVATAAAAANRQHRFALEGSVFIAGAAVQWLRDGLGVIDSSSDVEPLASTVPDSGGVHFVPAFAGLGAPHWDPHARGIITGLTRGSTAAHIARAALESIAFQSADVLEAMHEDAGVRLMEMRVDGGASVNNLLMQFQADIVGVPIVRPAVTETTALGAAYLAGLAVGFWKDESEIEQLWRADRIFEPTMSSELRANLLGEWRAAVNRTRSSLTLNGLLQHC